MGTRGSAPSAGGCCGPQLNSRIGRASAQPDWREAGLCRALHRQPDSPRPIFSSWLRSDACLFGLPRPREETVGREKASLDKEAWRPAREARRLEEAAAEAPPRSLQLGDSVRNLLR